MNKKIIAAVLAIFIIAFPFRRAFLSDEAPGIMMMFSFMLTVAGIIFFYYLTLEKSKE